MTAAAPTTTTGRLRPASVGALDVLTTRERDADHLAQALAAALGAEDVTIATHAVVVGTLRHVALTIGTARPHDPGALGTVLGAVAGRAGPPFGLFAAGEFRGEPELRPVLDAVIRAHRERRSGRVVVFPGWRGLTGTLTVADAVDRSALDRVHVLGGGTAGPDTLLVTRDFVRPRWEAGELVLPVQPAVGGTLMPFETPNPTPCCADHA